jgi:putative intracellular protease/amidase
MQAAGDYVMSLDYKHVAILVEDDYQELELHYPRLRLVRDGNLISSRTPDDLPAFCRTLLEALG